MSEGAALILLFFVATAVVSIAGWLREISRRKKIENRLWGIAAAQGINAPDFLAEMPINLPTKKRSDEHIRIEQLESQLDLVTQQLERLAESQEFLSRVMSERVDRLPDPRLRTPH